MKKNSPQVWDTVWSDPGLQRNDHIILASEAATVRWRKIRHALIARFGSLQGLRILEIGAGTGTYAALLAKEGAQASVLDYSEKALERAQEFFNHNRLSVELLHADALELPTSIKKKKFDVTISIGLTEHFKDLDRLKINQVHLDLLTKNGLAVMAVPNAYNPPYRIFKYVREKLGIWEFGEEYPYTTQELRLIAKRLGAKIITIFGDDLYSSIKFILPANFLRRLFKVGSPRNHDEIRLEKGTPLDDYLAYSLTMILSRD